jgi:hypothetical protein
VIDTVDKNNGVVVGDVDVANSILIQPVYVNDFKEVTGCTFQVPDTVLDVFQLIFTKDIVEYIVLETNRYARSFWHNDNHGYG